MTSKKERKKEKHFIFTPTDLLLPIHLMTLLKPFEFRKILVTHIIIFILPYHNPNCDYNDITKVIIMKDTNN